jgi:lipopolysaccharide biosynthesis glycosyltransferase
MTYSAKMMPFVLATSEDNYLAAAITMQSIIDNSEFECICIYVLVPSGFDNAKSRVFFELVSEYDNVSVQVMEMDNHRFPSNSKEPTGANRDRSGANYIATPAWFKISAATLLSQHDVCIYLDTDTVVVSSLLPLLDLDFGECYVAGVLAFGFILNRRRIKYAKVIGLPDYRSYVNTGVLIMNLELIRRDRIESKFFELVEEGPYDFYDQDVINIACYGRILAIPQKYNLTQESYGLFNGKLVLLQKGYLRYRSFEEMKEACLNPVIAHYPGASKPWNTENRLFGYLWLREAEIFLKRNLVPAIEYPRQNSHSCNLLSPYSPISIAGAALHVVSRLKAKLRKVIKSVLEKVIPTVEKGR